MSGKIKSSSPKLLPDARKGSVYPPESAIRPEFLGQVKKAEAGIRNGKGTTYESMGAFIRAISE